MRGSVSIKALYFLSRRGRAIKRKVINGHSKIMKLDTDRQREHGFKNAILHGGYIYLRAIKSYPYDPNTEYNYHVISSRINYLYRGAYKVRKAKITPKRKKELHEQIIIGNQERGKRMEEEHYESRKAQKRMYAKEVVVPKKMKEEKKMTKKKEPDYNKMTKAELIALLKKKK